MPSPVILEIQGLGRVELDLSAADWDRMTDGERQELVTRIAVDSGAVRPSQGLGAAALSSVTDSLPAAVSGGLAALGRATGLTSDETNRTLTDYAARQRAEAAASYQRDPTVADTVGQGWQRDGVSGAARSLITQGAEGIGTALPSVAATAGALALSAGSGGLAVPLIAGLAGTGLDATINAAGQQQERIRQGQSPDLTPSDLAAIGGSSALNLIPGGRSAGVIGSTLRMAGREGLENAAQEGLTMGSVAAQAPEGAPTPGVSDYADRLSNAGAVGAATGGALGGAGAVGRRAAGGALDMAGGGSRRTAVPEDPEVAQAERRVLQATQEATRTLTEQNGRAPDADEVIRTVREQQVREANALIDAAHEAGEITSEVRNDVRRAISDASSHTRRLYRTEADGTVVDGGLNVVDRVRVSNDRQTGMPEASYGALRRTLFDLEVASQNFKKGARIGPAQAAGETLGRVAGRLSAGGAGAFTAGPAGILAAAVPGPGGAGAAVGRAIGSRVDRMMGWQQPPVVRRAKAIAQSVRDDGSTTRDIQAEADAARIRSAERRGEADAERVKIAQERAEAKAMAAKARKVERATTLRERAADVVSGIAYRAELKARAKANPQATQTEASGVVARYQARVAAKAHARDRTDRKEPLVTPAVSRADSGGGGQHYGPKPRISVRAEVRAKAREAASISNGRPAPQARMDASAALLRAARAAGTDAETDAMINGRSPSEPVRNLRSYEDAVDRARVARESLVADADRLSIPELRTAATAIAGLKDRGARRARAQEAIDAVNAMESLPALQRVRITEDLRSLGNTGGRNTRLPPSVAAAIALRTQSQSKAARLD